MLVPDNCRVRKMGFSSASHLLRFHEWLWKRLASLIWLSMTLLFLWLWSFDRKLHVPLVRMNHAWFFWFLWNFLHSLGCSNESFRCSLILCRSWIHSLILDGTIYIYILWFPKVFYCVCDFVYAILCMQLIEVPHDFGGAYIPHVFWMGQSYFSCFLLGA